jgi:sugar lactone lactonase YvrE
VEAGGALLVLNQSSGALDRVTLVGDVTRDVLTGAPNAVEAEFAPDGRLWLTEYGSEVYVYDATMRRAQTLTGFDHPVGVVFDAAGNAYVSNSRFGGPGAAVIRITPAGARDDVVTGLSWPHDLAFDARGNLWVADYGSNRVLRFDAR